MNVEGPRWLVMIDGPEPLGKRFEDRKRAERWARRQKSRGMHVFLVDMSKTFAEMEPEEFE